MGISSEDTVYLKIYTNNGIGTFSIALDTTNYLLIEKWNPSGNFGNWKAGMCC